MATQYYEIAVKLQYVTNKQAERIVAWFESVMDANAYAKWLSENNKDRLVTVLYEDKETSYIRIWLNGERIHTAG